jgi:hypothetical protein
MNDERLSDFILAGGTNLALQLGHRKSVDLDLFPATSFDALQLKEYLMEKYRFFPQVVVENTVKGVMDDIKVDIIAYQYPLLYPLLVEDGIRMYSLQDIACMKLVAIHDNGMRLKDFVDIAYISTKMSLMEMFDCYTKKYNCPDYFYVIKSLTYYNDIDFSTEIEHMVQDFKTAEKALTGLYHMKGIGFHDQSERTADVGTNYQTLKLYAQNLPGDLAKLLDDPLFHVFADPGGATSLIALIDANKIQTHYAPGLSGYWDLPDGQGHVAQTTTTVSFDDFTGTDPDHYCMPGLKGVHDHADMPGFYDIFVNDYNKWKTSNPDLAHQLNGDYADYMNNIVHDGAFDHEDYHPVLSAIATVVSLIPVVGGVVGLIDAIAGKNIITGDQMNDFERQIVGITSVVDLVTLIGSIPSVATGSLAENTAKNILREFAQQTLENLIENSVQTLTSDMANALGLPPWACTLVAMGTAKITVHGGKYVIKSLSGAKLGEGLLQNTGILADDVVDSGNPVLWESSKTSNIDRGNIVGTKLSTDAGTKQQGSIWFNSSNGKATCIHSLDTTASSYLSTDGLRSQLESYVDEIADFGGNPKSANPVTTDTINSRLLKVGIPDENLSSAQIAAISDAKSYGKAHGVTVQIVVVE